MLAREVTVAALVIVLLTACGPATGTATATSAPTVTPTAAASAAVSSPVVAATAPAQTFTVQTRTLQLSRGVDRPLRTVVWYPVGTGPFPLILFSHGWGGEPEDYAAILTNIAAAGFVVAAPAYPQTSGAAAGATTDLTTIMDQPADASEVITDVLALAATPGDPFAGLIDPSRIGAAGHSAGGFTTTGLISTDRDPRLRSAVIIAGGPLGGTFTDPALPVLVVHGDADPVVPYIEGRSLYGQLPWPKAMLTVLGGDHTNFLSRDAPTGAVVWSVLLDFLRWSLYGDTMALLRMVRDGTAPGLTTLDSDLAS